jgi:hypothetical protein
VTVELVDEANLLVDEDVLESLRDEEEKVRNGERTLRRKKGDAPSEQHGNRTSEVRAEERGSRGPSPSPSSEPDFLARRTSE